MVKSRMKTRYRLIVAACAVVVLAAGWLVFLGRRAPALYRVTVLPSLGGDLMAAWAINDHGQVVGVAMTKDRTRHTFLWDREHGTQDLGEADGGIDINNAGQIIATMSDPHGNQQAFLWEPGQGRTPLGTLGGKTSLAWAINNQGQVIGTSKTSDGRDHPFLWDRVRGMQDLATLVGTDFSARAINDAGQVLGLKLTTVLSHTPVLKSEYFLWDPNQGIVTIGPLSPGARLDGLNLASWTVGEVNDLPSGRRMIAWNSSAGARDLFPLDLPLRHVAGFNDVNQIVYSAGPADRPSGISRRLLPSWVRRRLSTPHHPYYLWDPRRGKIPLDPHVSAGVRGVFAATDIDNKGCIVGAVTSGTNTPCTRAVLLEPVPERWAGRQEVRQ